MILEWRTIGYPIEIYGLLVVAGTCLLYAFVLHVKMRNLARMNREQREQFKTGMERWAQEAESLRSEISAQPPLRSQLGVNLNQRGQVLRMRRRGESPETIAAALGIPRNEVDLLFKVHRLALEQANGATVI